MDPACSGNEKSGGGENGVSVVIDMDLPPEPSSARKARESLERLAGGVPYHKLEDARLAVSEIVTNSLRHANLSPEDGRVSLHVEVADGLLGGKVCDTGRGFEVRDAPSPGGFLGGGWGLYLVDAVSVRWGVERNGMFCVWFEIEV
jgi:anti-sigma regulatory factor (Ser/Thr protein kinase)